MLRTEKHGTVERGFADIWRDAQRRRSEYLSTVGRQFFQETGPPNSIRRATRITGRSAASQSEHTYLAFDSKSGSAADRPSNVPDRSGRAA